MDRKDLLQKWLNDELSPAEKQVFEQGDDFAMEKAIIENAKHFKASNFSQPKTFEAFQSYYQNKKPTKETSKWFRPLLKIASVLVIAFGVYFTFFYNNLTHVQTIAGEQTIIELPDASRVILNAESTIEYKVSNWDINRRLHLDGEAYFKVAKGETFEVVTTQGVVTVVGTEFNVKQRQDYFEVQCFEGVVSVTSNDITKKLLAGDTYRVLNNKFSQDKITQVLPEWTQNRSTFKAIPFTAVVAEMERQYGVIISIEQVDANRLFTGGFIHDDIDNALLSITQPMSLSYKTNASNDIIIYDNKK
ncbi:FecR family protein [Psychroserpens sp. MEBiC05023]